MTRQVQNCIHNKDKDFSIQYTTIGHARFYVVVDLKKGSFLLILTGYWDRPYKLLQSSACGHQQLLPRNYNTFAVGE